MTIPELLEDVSTKIPDNSEGKGHSYYYGEKGWQNLVGSDTVFPLMSVDFIGSMKFNLQKSRFIGEQYPAAIYVCDKSELDATTAEHEVILEREKIAARSVLSQLMNYKDAQGNNLIDKIEFITDATRIILRPSDDVGTTGVLLPILITPSVHLSVCNL